MLMADLALNLFTVSKTKFDHYDQEL
jgi:hypothetical protein